MAMHEIMSLNLAELWMALNVKEALDKFLDLIEGIKEEEARQGQGG